MAKKKPNFFIVGAPKCGTTSMYHYLKEHPDVYFPKVKEPNFFNTDLERSNRFTKDEYLNLYSNVNEEKRIGDATPLYLMSTDAPLNIRNFNKQSNLKFIILLRNPIDLVYSAFFQNKVNGIEPIESFKEAIDNQHKRRAGYKLFKDMAEPIERLEYDRFVDFKDNITRWEKVFGKEHVMVLLLDELKNEFESVLTRVYSFLEIQHIDTPKNEVHNVATKNRNDGLLRILKHPPKIVSKIGRTLLSNKQRSKIFKSLKGLNETTFKKEEMSEAMRLQLLERYINEIEYVELRVNKDLNHWKK